VTHTKQQKLIYQIMGRRYNTQFLLYPRPMMW